MTTVGDKLYELGGVPVGGPIYNGPDPQVLFVDGNITSAVDGSTWSKAYKTIGSAVNAATAYTTIYVAGSSSNVGQTDDYNESVVIPYAKNGIRIIGCGNSNSEGALWGSSATDSTVCLAVYARDCYVSGFRFRPEGASGASIALLKDTGALYGALADSSGFTIENCVFRSQTTTAGGIAMGSTASSLVSSHTNSEGSNDVTVRDVTFDSVLYAVKCTVPATVGNRLHIIDCTVTGKATVGFQATVKESLIKNCTVMDLAGGMMCDTDPGNSGTITPENMVTGCVFGSEGSAIAEVHCGTTDSWAGSIFGDFNDSATYIDTTTGGFIIAPDNA